MKIIMSSVSYEDNSAATREKISFDEERIAVLCRKICYNKNILGCVIISTCNRTEIYLSCEDNMNKYADELLLEAAEIYNFCGRFRRMKNREAVYYLIELACGLKSRIKGEEQITGQINNAVEISRKAGCSDGVLNTLFRIAVTAGKYRMTNARIGNASISSAYGAVKLIEEREGNLKGRKCIIIGNGKMGRAAQRLLIEKGCDVYVTLRSYKGGNNEIIKGCMGIRYEDRYEYAGRCDYLISCTKSPHYTITKDNLEKIGKVPKIMIDLAMPRDIEEGIECINIDGIGGNEEINDEDLSSIGEIVERYAERFFIWKNYRMSISVIEDIKRITGERILRACKIRETEIDDEIVKRISARTADIIFGAMNDDIKPEKMKRYRKKIKERGRL